MTHAANPAMTQAEYARHAGVNRSQITRWLQSGRITALPSGLIDPVAADAQRSATESPMPHHQARKAQIDAEKAMPIAEEEQGQEAAQGHQDMAELGRMLKRETWRLQKAKAERENMELDVRAGALVERSEVDMVLADLGATLRARLEAMPDRITPECIAIQEAGTLHKYLADTFADFLAEFSQEMGRKTDLNC